MSSHQHFGTRNTGEELKDQSELPRDDAPQNQPSLGWSKSFDKAGLNAESDDEAPEEEKGKKCQGLLPPKIEKKSSKSKKKSEKSGKSIKPSKSVDI